MDEKEIVTHALNALQRLLDMYKPERYLYLAGSVSGLIVAIYYVGNLLWGGNIAPQDAGLLIGGSGFISIASFRVSYIFNRSFNLIEKLILLLGRINPPDDSISR